jgi:CRP-like cAMP-binding protein
MNFFYQEYPLSEHTLALKHNKKAYAYSCIIDFFMFLGLKDVREFHSIEQYFTYAHYKKNTVLSSKDVISKKFFFIAEGATRTYKIEGEEEHTLLLSTEGTINTHIESLLNGTVPDATLVTTEDCSILELTYDNFERMQLENSHMALAISRGMAMYLKFQQSFSSIMKEDAKTKFDYLQIHMPQISNRFPLKYQASYLGIKPETLSRIRNEIRFK